MTEQKVPDFLIEESEKDQQVVCDLKRLAELVKSLKEAEDKVDEINQQLSDAKAVKTRLSQEIIPEFLNKFGISNISLEDGTAIKIEDDASITIKSKPLFFNWLKERKEDDIIKLNIAFDKMESEKREKLFEFILDNDYDCENEEKVHSATQKAYFKRLLGIGKKEEDIKAGLESGSMVLPEKIEPFAKIYTFKKTKVKNPK